MQAYPEYTWLDYSEYFISPGLIDLNVSFSNEYSVGDEETMEYEGSAISENSSCLTSSNPETLNIYEAGTRQAAAGGVTLVVDNPGLFNKDSLLKDFIKLRQSIAARSLYCDLATLAELHVENLDEAQSLVDLGAVGFKSFMLSPGHGVPYIHPESIVKALNVSAKTGKTIFFHPERTNERFLYMSSPFRNEPLSNRKFKPEPAFAAFPGAFPEEVEGSGSEVSPISSSGSTPMRNTPLSNFSRVDEKVLEKQIIFQSNNLESLIKAEISTYSSSGLTVFEPDSPEKGIPDIGSIGQAAFSQMALRLNKSPLFDSRSPVNAVPIFGKSRRPPPITCMRPSAPKENRDYKIYLANCPPHWEVNGVQAILSNLPKVPDAQIHISNLSSATAIYAVHKYKKEQKSHLTCETSSIYLYFSDESIKPGDTRFKSNPPIREEKNRKLMLEILSVGGIDAVSSYHRAIHPSMKFLHLGDFKRALSGVHSLGFTLQVLNEIYEDEPKYSAIKMAKVLSEKPAEILGLQFKGSIAVGKHADLVVWDPSSITDSQICAKSCLSVFQHDRMKGKVLVTYVRGKIVYSNGCFWPHGKLI